MKTLFLVITFGIILHSPDLTAQWQPDLRLTYDGGESITSPNNSWGLASEGDNVMAVWYDNGDGNYEIYYKRSADGGATWGPDIRLTNDPGISWYSSIALSGGNVNVVWQDNRDGNKEIYCKLSTDGGSGWYGDLRLTNNSASSEYPSAAASGSNVHVVWQDNQDGNWEIYHMRSTDGGFNWQAQNRLTFNTAVSNSPCVSVSGLNVHVVWEDTRDGGNWCIYYKHSADGGVNWGPDTRLTFETASNLPSVFAAGSDVHIVWKDNRDFNPEIYYKHSLDGGNSWSADTRLTVTPLSSWAPTLTVSGSSVHVVWYDNSEGNNEIYYTRSVNKGTSWAVNTRITNNTSISKNPFVTASGSAVHVVWYDERDGNSEIYYKKDPTGNPIGIINISSEIPGMYSLMQNYPNPFNPSTKITFQLSVNSFTTIKVYDLLGKEVETLVNNELAAGTYKVDFNGSGLSSGVYFCKMETLPSGAQDKGFLTVKKMILSK
jgi:hypothetical protein